MFIRILAICGVALAAVIWAEAAPAANRARQFLPAVPGYVPVYIRAGDTPLEDINPDLAEAFDSYHRKQARLARGRARPPSNGRIQVTIDASQNFDSELNAVLPPKSAATHSKHNIQIIARN